MQPYKFTIDKVVTTQSLFVYINIANLETYKKYFHFHTKTLISFCKMKPKYSIPLYRCIMLDTLPTVIGANIPICDADGFLIDTRYIKRLKRGGGGGGMTIYYTTVKGRQFEITALVHFGARTGAGVVKP